MVVPVFPHFQLVSTVLKEGIPLGSILVLTKPVMPVLHSGLKIVYNKSNDSDFAFFITI